MSNPVSRLVRRTSDKLLGEPWGTRPFLLALTLISLVATTGSLYLSLGLGLVPCELCWYQRILMYPLVVILGVASYEKRASVYRTALPLSILGGIIAAYHSYLQISQTQCAFGSQFSCATVQYRVFGLTVPNLSLIAFFLITAGLVFIYRKNK